MKKIYINNKYGNWLIIKYKNNDWSVYLKDIDGIYQYQITYKTKTDAKAHCCC